LVGGVTTPPTPLYLFTTWRLYDYRINRSPLFGQTDTIQQDATALALQYSKCATTCFYLIRTLPYGTTGTRVFFTKIGWRGVVGDPEGLAIAQSLEVNAGPTLLNPYYNYGSVGTVSKGDTVYAVPIMTHYAVDPPQ
jgi:hypothetical protein